MIKHQILLFRVKMDIAAQRLFEYYLSPQAPDDLRWLADRDPARAAEQRETIARRLNENFAFLGAMPSELDLAAQVRFVEGVLQPDEFFAQIHLYAQSISSRWSAFG